MSEYIQVTTFSNLTVVQQVAEAAGLAQEHPCILVAFPMYLLSFQYGTNIFCPPEFDILCTVDLQERAVRLVSMIHKQIIASESPQSHP